MIDSSDLSPGSSPWNTNRTNRTRLSGGKYESAHFFTPELNRKTRYNDVYSKTFYPAYHFSRMTLESQFCMGKFS